MRYSLIIIASYCLIGFPSAPVASEPPPLIVAHPSAPVDSLSRDQIVSIYYGYMTRWHDGSDLLPVMRKDGPVQDQFIAFVLGKTPRQFKSYWRQAIFTGEGIPPKTFKTNAELLAYVAQTPGAIGFAASLPDSIHLKKLRVIDL